MHKHLSRVLAISLVIALPAAANAQVRKTTTMATTSTGTMFGIGAGILLPLGNYSTGDNLGFNILGTAEFPLRNSPVNLRADLMFSTTSHKNSVGGSTRLLGGDVDAVYNLSKTASTARPYLLGGLGLYNVHVSITGFGSGSNTNVAMNLGGGINFTLGSTTHAFAEARFLDIFTSGGSTTAIPITVGLRFSGH